MRADIDPCQYCHQFVEVKVGKIHVALTREELNIQRAIDSCRSDDCGAEILFLGTVRNINEGRGVNAVNYDGHITLGERILREICFEAQKTWGDGLNLLVEHRLGLLNVGEVSLIIHVTSPHRDSAYMSSRYIIEEIKVRLPVWKEEVYTEGETEWLKGTPLNQI